MNDQRKITVGGSSAKRTTHLGHAARKSVFDTAAKLRPSLYLNPQKKKPNWHPKNWHFQGEESDEEEESKEVSTVETAVKLFKKKSNESISAEETANSETKSMKNSASQPALHTAVESKTLPQSVTPSRKTSGSDGKTGVKEFKTEDEENEKGDTLSLPPLSSTPLSRKGPGLLTPISSQPLVSLESAMKNRKSAEKAQRLAMEVRHRKTLELGEVLEELEAARLLEDRIREDRQEAVKELLAQNSASGENSEHINIASKNLKKLENEAHKVSQTIARYDNLLRQQTSKNDAVLKKYRDEALRYQSKAEEEVTLALVAAETKVIEASNSAQKASQKASQLQRELESVLERERLLRLEAEEAEKEALRARQEERALAGMRVAHYLEEWNGISSSDNTGPVTTTQFRLTPQASHNADSSDAVEKSPNNVNPEQGDMVVPAAVVGQLSGEGDGANKADPTSSATSGGDSQKRQEKLADKLRRRRRSSISNILEDKLIIWENQLSQPVENHMQLNKNELAMELDIEAKSDTLLRGGDYPPGHASGPPSPANSSISTVSRRGSGQSNNRVTRAARLSAQYHQDSGNESSLSNLTSQTSGGEVYGDDYKYYSGLTTEQVEKQIPSSKQSEKSDGLSQSEVGSSPHSAAESSGQTQAARKRKVLREDWERKVHGELEDHSEDEGDSSSNLKRLSPIQCKDIEYDKEGHLVHHASQNKRGSVKDVIGDGLEAWEVRERSKSAKLSEAAHKQATQLVNGGEATYDQTKFKEPAEAVSTSTSGVAKEVEKEGIKEEGKEESIVSDEIDEQLKRLQKEEEEKYKTLLNYDAKTGYYEIIFENSKLGIGLHAAIDNDDLPVVTSVADQSHNKPFGDRLCKVGSVELAGQEDTYEKAVALIKGSGRPLTLGFVPLKPLDLEARQSPMTDDGEITDGLDVKETTTFKAPPNVRLASLTPEPIGPPPEDLVPTVVKDAASTIQRMFRGSQGNLSSNHSLASDKSNSVNKSNQQALSSSPTPISSSTKTEKPLPKLMSPEHAKASSNQPIDAEESWEMEMIRKQQFLENNTSPASPASPLTDSTHSGDISSGAAVVVDNTLAEQNTPSSYSEHNDSRRSSTMSELCKDGLELWEVKQKRGSRGEVSDEVKKLQLEHKILNSKRTSHLQIMGRYTEQGKDAFLHDLNPQFSHARFSSPASLQVSVNGSSGSSGRVSDMIEERSFNHSSSSHTPTSSRPSLSFLKELKLLKAASDFIVAHSPIPSPSRPSLNNSSSNNVTPKSNSITRLKTSFFPFQDSGGGFGGGNGSQRASKGRFPSSESIEKELRIKRNNGEISEDEFQESLKKISPSSSRKGRQKSPSTSPLKPLSIFTPIKSGKSLGEELTSQSRFGEKESASSASSIPPRKLQPIEKEQRIRSNIKSNAREWLMSSSSANIGGNNGGMTNNAPLIPSSPLLG